jgi:hypothetical protein
MSVKSRRKKTLKEIPTQKDSRHRHLPSFGKFVEQALAVRPTRAVIVIITAEGAARMVEDFALYRGMSFQEPFEVVVLVQIFLAGDQIGVVAQLGRYLGMVLQEIVELPHLIAQIAPGRSRGAEDRQR